MKKIAGSIFFLCLLLTGCNEVEEADSFYTNSNGEIVFGQAPRDWSVEIVLVTILLIVLGFSVILMRRNLLYKNNKNWEKTMATFTGMSNTYMYSKRGNGYYSVPIQKTEFQIKYSVNGKCYDKYVGEEELGSQTNRTINETLMIEYLKRRPSTMRVLK